MSDITRAILYKHHRRKMDKIVPHLPADYLFEAARFALARRLRVVIITGFYILEAGAVETDGPPGAAALGRAFERLGGEVHIVSDIHLLKVWEDVDPGFGHKTWDFPVAGCDESREVARELLDEIEPTLVVAVERCGENGHGIYGNFRGADISAYTARTDEIFHQFGDTIAIGDGGNELGMGNVADHVDREVGISGCRTGCEHLVVSTVSNWGAYGLVRAMELLEGRGDLLWTGDDEGAYLEGLAAKGVVEGMSGEAVARVDGFSEDEGRTVLGRLAGLAR